MVFTEYILMPEAPGAAVALMLVCMTISFINSSINRLLISRFVGWDQYRNMQKELSEYRQQTNQALRSKDKKLLEKLKKKEGQVMNMQKKMMKPQMILMGLSMSYLIIWWVVLLPVYKNNTVAYIPGFGPISVLYWYLICSLLFGALSSRLLGITQ